METKMSKLVYNYGNNDVLFNVIIDGKQIKEYKLWTSMLQRCYSKTFQDKNPTYIDCKVCDEWLKFSNFYSYCQQNKQWLDLGYQLDKDLLIKNNKLYSPSTCLWLPKELNDIILTNKKSRGDLPLGVTLGYKKFRVAMNMNGKLKHFGSYETKEEAFLVYKKNKELYIQEKTHSFKNVLTTQAYKALMEYKVEYVD